MDQEEMNRLAAMIRIAIERSGIPAKVVAREANISLSAVYSAEHGTRKFPAQATTKFSEMNMIAAATMAAQSTGLLSLFRYRNEDRHVQSRIVQMRAYDSLVDDILDDLPMMLFNKQSREDLTAHDMDVLLKVADILSARLNVTLNLLMELDLRFDLKLAERLKQMKGRPIYLIRRP